MVPVARLETLAHQECKVWKVFTVIEDLEDQKEMEEVRDLLVTLDIVNVIR